MTPSGHLADEQFTRHRDRALSPAEVLEVDAHIAECSECLARLYVENRAAAGIRALRARLASHLGYAEIVACSEGQGKPQQLQHLRECPGCQGDVQDLSRFRTERVEIPRKALGSPPRNWGKYNIPLGIAAAVLLVGGTVTFVLTRRTAAPVDAPPTVQRADPAIPAVEREILQKALSNFGFARAPVLAELITRQPGASSMPKEFETLGPFGTVVVMDRPVFRWKFFAEAADYTVVIFDSQSRKLVESPALTSTDWSPPEPLPRGVTLKWRVTARTRSGATRQAPADGEPEARFQVIPQATVDRIETMRRDFPGNPLLLAALFANAGALDAAEDHLKAVEAATGARYRESIRNIREPR
jgi:hypothetical protein